MCPLYLRQKVKMKIGLLYYSFTFFFIDGINLKLNTYLKAI